MNNSERAMMKHLLAMTAICMMTGMAIAEGNGHIFASKTPILANDATICRFDTPESPVSFAILVVHYLKNDRTTWMFGVKNKHSIPDGLNDINLLVSFDRKEPYLLRKAKAHDQISDLYVWPPQHNFVPQFLNQLKVSSVIHIGSEGAMAHPISLKGSSDAVDNLMNCVGEMHKEPIN